MVNTKSRVSCNLAAVPTLEVGGDVQIVHSRHFAPLVELVDTLALEASA